MTPSGKEQVAQRGTELARQTGDNTVYLVEPEDRQHVSVALEGLQGAFKGGLNAGASAAMPALIFGALTSSLRDIKTVNKIAFAVGVVTALGAVLSGARAVHAANLHNAFADRINAEEAAQQTSL